MCSRTSCDVMIDERCAVGCIAHGELAPHLHDRDDRHHDDGARENERYQHARPEAETAISVFDGAAGPGRTCAYRRYASR